MCSYTFTLHIRKNTHKSKFLLSQAFKWEKIMFFVIPEIPSKTFVMVLKKLPDHFKKQFLQELLAILFIKVLDPDFFLSSLNRIRNRLLPVPKL